MRFTSIEWLHRLRQSDYLTSFYWRQNSPAPACWIIVIISSEMSVTIIRCDLKATFYGYYRVWIWPFENLKSKQRENETCISERYVKLSCQVYQWQTNSCFSQQFVFICGIKPSTFRLEKRLAVPYETTIYNTDKI